MGMETEQIANPQPHAKGLLIMSKRFLIPAFLILWVFFWHGHALKGYFLADDWFLIASSPISDVLKTFAGDLNVENQGPGGMYRPLVKVSFAIERLVWGYWFPGYVLTSLFLISLNIILLWIIARYVLPEREFIALAVAMVYVLLPTNAEVAWFVGTRADHLAGIGILGAVVFRIIDLKKGGKFNAKSRLGFIKSPRFISYAFLVFGLLSKEEGFAGVILLPLVDFIYLNNCARIKDTVKVYKRWAKESLMPALGIGLVYSTFRYIALGCIGQYWGNNISFLGPGHLLGTYLTYLSALWWPPGSGGEYNHCFKILNFCYEGWQAWMLFFIAGLMFAKERKGLLLGISGLLITIAPMIGLNFNVQAHGRLLFIPGAWGILAWGAWISEFIKYPPLLKRKIRIWKNTTSNILELIVAFLWILLALTWTTTLSRNSMMWKRVANANRTIMSETWEIIDTLPRPLPEHISIITPEHAYYFHLWNPGDNIMLAILDTAPPHGLHPRWDRLDKPYPTPILIDGHDNKGRATRIWQGLSPDVTTGSLVLMVRGDGSITRMTVASTKHIEWCAEDLAKWSFKGAGHIQFLNKGIDHKRLSVIVKGYDVVLKSHPGRATSTNGAGSGISVKDSKKIADRRFDNQWMVVGITGKWNSPGNALLWIGNKSRYPNIGIPVPPAFNYRTAFGQVGFFNWPQTIYFCPLDRPGEVTLEGLDIYLFSLKSYHVPASKPSVSIGGYNSLLEDEK